MACAETNQWNRHELLQPMKEGTYENGVERHAAKQKAPMNWVPCTFSDILELIPLHKYVIIVLGDADNVEGIPFANSLCKHARLGLLPNQQGAYEEVSTYYRDRSYPTRISKSAYRLWFVLHFHLLPPNLCVAIWLCILMNEHYVSWMVGLIIFLLSRWSPCSSCMCYYGHCLNLWHKPLALKVWSF